MPPFCYRVLERRVAGPMDFTTLQPKSVKRTADVKLCLGLGLWVQYSGLFVNRKAAGPRNRYCPYLMLIPYDLCCTLSDDHTGSHRIAGGHAWHDRSVRDAKVVDAVDFEEAIHHTHGVAAHLGGGRLMPKAKGCVADVVFQFWTFQVVGNDLSPDKRTKSAGVAYLATKLYTCDGCLQIIWVTEIIRFNLNGIGGIGAGKADTTTTLGLNNITDEGPTTRRKAKFCCVRSAQYSLQNLEVRTI